MDLSFDVSDRNGWTVLAVGGEIDMYTSPALRQQFAQLVDEGRRKIVVDLERVEFLDSSGLGVLVGGLKRVRTGDDGELALVCTRRSILKVFEITGLHKVFAVHSSVESATDADA